MIIQNMLLFFFFAYNDQWGLNPYFLTQLMPVDIDPKNGSHDRYCFAYV